MGCSIAYARWCSVYNTVLVAQLCASDLHHMRGLSSTSCIITAAVIICLAALARSRTTDSTQSQHTWGEILGF